MGWKKVEIEEPHTCDKPYAVNSGIGAGDVVECDCGQQWKCKAVDYGMQHDPLPYGVLKWKKV